MASGFSTPHLSFYLTRSFFLRQLTFGQFQCYIWYLRPTISQEFLFHLIFYPFYHLLLETCLIGQLILASLIMCTDLIFIIPFLGIILC